MNLTRILNISVAVLALLAFFALVPRLKVERPGPVSLVMDGNEIEDIARISGKSFMEEAEIFAQKGINGIAVYEETIKTLVDEGSVQYQPENNLESLFPSAKVKPGWFYLSGDQVLLERLKNSWLIPNETIEIGKQRWLGFPVDVSVFPAGFNTGLIQALKSKGFLVIARPFENPFRKIDASLIPQGADAVLFGGTEVLGFRDRLGESQAAINHKPIAMIEGTPQDGFPKLAKSLPVLRLFGLKPEWQAKLAPAETADKYLLASRERGHQLLYLRPYENPSDTDELISTIVRDLGRSKIAIGNPVARSIEQSPFRHAAVLGVAVGLVLLAIGLGNTFGPLVAVMLALFAVGYAKGDSIALLAALVFPAVGLMQERTGLWRWVAAVLFALAGVIFLNAWGSKTETILGLAAFKGVSLTLVVPPFLVALSLFPKKIKQSLIGLWTYPIRLGEVAVAVIGLAVIALVILRRGNDTSAGITPDWEIKLRAVLQDVMVRPRFKEVFAAALAPIALMFPWPRWLRNGLLLMVSVGIASILNTFSHYHTPLSISFFRTINGLIIGVVIGLIALEVLERANKWWEKQD